MDQNSSHLSVNQVGPYHACGTHRTTSTTSARGVCFVICVDFGFVYALEKHSEHVPFFLRRIRQTLPGKTYRKKRTFFL